MKCSYCGEELKDGELFCPKCGTKNDIPNPTEKREVPESTINTLRKTRRFRNILGLITIIVIVVMKIQECNG